MRRVAALLRAVNVGGQGAIPMADLRALLSEAGFEGPETLLASGNALIGTSWDDARTEARFESAVAERFGFKTDVLVRGRDQLAATMAANAFPEMAADKPNLLIVMFLRGEPQERLDVLESYCTSGERVALGPACLYLAYPAGSGTSKLSGAVIERKLGVRGTGRNWNTVGKLLTRLS
ncbi:DUF1697 domain-containing protein [Phenylobacterium sp.]|uniref:DUF1697 domain-containing protein n=1 Tax=Phenylobacterium sp. TaxID=1871053 RepID=UPI00301CEEBC